MIEQGYAANAVRPNTPRPVSVIEGQINEIGARIKRLRESAAIINDALSRLVNPTPEPPGGEKCAELPNQGTVEGKLQEICSQLEDLVCRFESHANKLNHAI